VSAQPKGEKVYHEPRDGPRKPVPQPRPTNEELDAIEEEEQREVEKESGKRRKVWDLYI
jgi:hypothetical protein